VAIKMSDKKGGPLFGIGGLTLLTVLLVLCLTMFSVLSFSAAQADGRLSRKNAAVVSAFYQADLRAVEMMWKAERVWLPGAPAPLYEHFGFLEAEYGAWIDISDEGLMIFAEVPVYEGSYLWLSLFMNRGESGDAGGAGRWVIYEWQVLPPDQDLGGMSTLPVWMPPELPSLG
jgi:hypothetical protein